MSELMQRINRINGARVENLSDANVTRIRLIFDNGYELSIIQSKAGAGFSSAYGTPGESVELALFDGDGEFTQILWPEEYDDVIGWQTFDEAISYAEKAAALPPFIKVIPHTVVKELD